MPNILKKEKQVQVISMLAEGSSIRAIERVTNIHRDSIMRLGVKVGNACIKFMDADLKNLTPTHWELDELWSWVGKKQGHLTSEDNPLKKGDFYIFIALDRQTKLIPSFLVGKRDSYHAKTFLEDLATRVINRPQISTDAFAAYLNAVEQGFGNECDYGQIVKTFTCSDLNPGRYSPPEIYSAKKSKLIGNPEMKDICTSHVESHNLTLRTHCRRLTRLTSCYSKKLENHKASIGLYLTYYNYVRRHSTLRCTPAMASGVRKDFMSVSDMIDLAN